MARMDRSDRNSEAVSAMASNMAISRAFIFLGRLRLTRHIPVLESMVVSTRGSSFSDWEEAVENRRQRSRSGSRGLNWPFLRTNLPKSLWDLNIYVIRKINVRIMALPNKLHSCIGRYTAHSWREGRRRREKRRRRCQRRTCLGHWSSLDRWPCEEWTDAQTAEKRNSEFQILKKAKMRVVCGVVWVCVVVVVMRAKLLTTLITYL